MLTSLGFILAVAFLSFSHLKNENGRARDDCANTMSGLDLQKNYSNLADKFIRVMYGSAKSLHNTDVQ